MLGVQGQFEAQSETLERQKEAESGRERANVRNIKNVYTQWYLVSLQQNLVRKFECTLALGFSNAVLLGWWLLFCLLAAWCLYAA